MRGFLPLIVRHAVQPGEVAEEEGLEVRFVGDHLGVCNIGRGGSKGSDALCVLLPGVGAEEDGGRGVWVVDVVGWVHAGAQVEARMAKAALPDAIPAKIVDPPCARKLDGNFGGRTVAEGACCEGGWVR